MLQPHKGPSETGSDIADEFPTSVLQPHKGPSETRPTIEDAVTEYEELQPHKGPSETTPRLTSHSTKRTLQPHKGPSETGLPRAHPAQGRGFNPTRVLLKRGQCRRRHGRVCASTPQGSF